MVAKNNKRNAPGVGLRIIPPPIIAPNNGFSSSHFLRLKGREGKYCGKTAPPISAPSFKKLWGKLLKLLKGTSRAKVKQEGKGEGIFEGNINGVAAIEVGSGRGATLVWRFFAVTAGFLSCSGGVELLFRFDRCSMKSRAAGKCRVGSSVPTGAGSSRTEQCTKGSIMDEDLQMSSGSDFVPSKAGGSTEDSVSLVEESGGEVGASGSEGDEVGDNDADSPEGSIYGRSRKRRREPSMEGRRWRRKAAGDGFAFDKDGRGGRSVVPVSVRGRCMLDKICKFNKTVQPYHREAIEGTILKPVLEYRPFSMQTDLTAALVKAWVPRRKAFRLAGRLVPFSIYDVAFCIGLPVTAKIVEFAEGDLSTIDIVRMVWFYEHTTQFAKYDKGMFPCLASWDSVDHGGRYDAFALVARIKEFEIIPVLHPQPEEMGVLMIRDFMKSPEYGYYILDGEGVLSYEEQLHRARQEAHEEWEKLRQIERRLQFWMSHAHELEARLKLSKAPTTQEEGGEQPGGDVGEAIQTETEMECLGWPGIDLGEAVEHGSREGDGGAPDAPVRTGEGKTGDSIGAPDIVPSSAVEDVGHTLSGSPSIRSREGMAGGDGADREHHEAASVYDDSGVVPDTGPGDDAGNPEGGVSGCGGEDAGSHTSGGEGVPIEPASGVGNMELGISAAMTGVGEDVAVEGAVPSVDHSRTMAPETADVTAEDAAVDEACADPPLGQSGDSMANLVGDVDRTVGSDSNGNPDVEGVPCEGEGAGDSSNIVTRMKRRPRCRKLAAVHRTPYTDPTQHHGGRKKQKDLTNEGMGEEKAPGGDEPSEGEVATEILDMPPIAVEGSRFWQRALLHRCRQLRRSSSTQFGGGGREGVLAETGACELVARPHQRGPKCRSRGKVREVTLQNKVHIAAMIWDTFKRPPHADVCYVFMSLLETTEGHWLLLVVDLRDRCFIVYDSLPNAADKNRQALIDSTRIAFILAFVRSASHANAAQWELCNPPYPEQMNNGHDCGVFVVAFMELLCLKANGFHLDQDCIPLYRDKCLLSFIQGRVAHFPQHLRGVEVAVVGVLSVSVVRDSLLLCSYFACIDDVVLHVHEHKESAQSGEATLKCCCIQPRLAKTKYRDGYMEPYRTATYR
ncbi:hypothetical protein Cgig2_014852 [Carnegiea gigantea]|uniref:Ubiquitin-like protease family profile domain-containing protein n=1 Tax=Carnegiea gigantea TaxID=171969 RepID=A0A9Q1QT16_9CARY|nr:hypothetical protein Cgig2_014852 [Carnegiea gigantea]